MSATDLEKLLPKHKLVKVAEVKEAASQRQRKCEDMLISEEDFIGANFDPFAEENREFAREFYSSNHYRLKMPFMREVNEGKEGAGAVNNGSDSENTADVESDTRPSTVKTGTPHSSDGRSAAVSASAAASAMQQDHNLQNTSVSSDHTTTDDGYYVADEALATDNESALPPAEREWQGAGKWYTPEEKAQVQPERQLFTPVGTAPVQSGAQQEAADMSAALGSAPLARASKRSEEAEVAPVTTTTTTSSYTSDFQDDAPWLQLSPQDKENLLYERITMSLDGGVTQFSVEELALEFDLPQEFVAAMINEYISPVYASAAASTAGQAIPEDSASLQDSPAQAGSTASAALYAAQSIADSTTAEAVATTSPEPPAAEERSGSGMTMEECLKELQAFAAELEQSEPACTTKKQRAAVAQCEARGDFHGNDHYSPWTQEDDSDVALRQLSAMLYASKGQRNHESQHAVTAAKAAANAVARVTPQDEPVNTESIVSAPAAPAHAADTETGTAGISSEKQSSVERLQSKAAMSPEDSDFAALKQFMQDVAVAKAAAQAEAETNAAANSVGMDAEGADKVAAASSVSVGLEPDNSDTKLATSATTNTTASEQYYAAKAPAPTPAPAVSAFPELLPPLPPAQPAEPRMSWQERDQLIKYNDQGEVLDMSLDAIMAAVEDYQGRHPEDDSLISTTGIEILPEDARAAKQRQRLAQQRAAAIEQAYDEAALKKSRWAKRQQQEQVADFDSAASIDDIPWESEAIAATEFVSGVFVPTVPLAALEDSSSSSSFADAGASAEEDGTSRAVESQDVLAAYGEQHATLGADAGANAAEKEARIAALATAADTASAAQGAAAHEATAAAKAVTALAKDTSAQDKPKSDRTVLSLKKSKSASKSSSKSTTKTTSKGAGHKSRAVTAVAAVTAVHAAAQSKAEDSVSTNDRGGAPWVAIATTTTVEAATAALQAAHEAGAGDSEALSALHVAKATATKQRQGTPRPAKSSTTAKARSSNSKTQGKTKATTSKGKKGSAAKAPSKRSRSQGSAKD